MAATQISASLTSLTRDGYARGRATGHELRVGERVLAVDDLAEIQAEAIISEVHGVTLYLTVDWDSVADWSPPTFDWWNVEGVNIETIYFNEQFTRARKMPEMVSNPVILHVHTDYFDDHHIVRVQPTDLPSALLTKTPLGLDLRWEEVAGPQVLSYWTTYSSSVGAVTDARWYETATEKSTGGGVRSDLVKAS